MKKILKHLSFIVIFLITFFMLSPTYAADTAAQPLIITEVKSNCATAGFCFFELYNNSEQNINLKEYNIYYMYPSSIGQTWSVSSDLMLNPGKTMVFWLDEDNLSIDKFNSYYGVNLKENETLYKINYSGLHGDLKRGFKIGKTETDIVAECWFNETMPDTVVDVYDGAIQYKYSADNGIVETKLATNYKPSPGKVGTNQIPKTDFSPVSDKNTPVIENVNTKDTFNPTDAITFSATVTDVDANNICLYYRQPDINSDGKTYSEPYIRAQMLATGNANEYSVTIDKNTLWSDSISWFIQAGNGEELAISEEKTSEIKYNTDISMTSPLLITEIVSYATDSKTGGKYTYVEFYNNSDKPINLAYYNIYYMYGDSVGKTWNVPLPEMFIQPGKAMVGWLDSKGKTVADFNKYFGVSLKENVDIFKINYDSMHSTAIRGFKIGRTADTTFVKAYFNENGKDLYLTTNKNSIKYTYPRNDNYTCEKVSTKTKATPGKVDSWQIPGSTVSFKGYDGYTDAGTTPTLELADGIPTAVQEGKGLNIAFNCSDVVPIHTIIMYYKRNGDSNYTQVIDKSQRIAGKYFATVYANELLGYDSVEFYVEAYSPFRHVTSGKYTVAINRINNTNDSVRLNLKDNQVVSNKVTITANDGGDNKNTTISIDGQNKDTKTMMESGAYLYFVTDGIDSYFKNAVTAGDDVLYYMAKWAGLFSRAVHVDNKYFTKNADGSWDVTLTIWAGTSVSHDEIGTSTNNDDYTITGLKLYLPNGQFIEADNNDPNGKQINSTTIYKMGDSSGMYEKLDVHFTIPADKMTAIGFELDTTQLADGKHNIVAISGEKTTSSAIIIDNTKPEINFGIEDGALLKNSITVNPIITDANQIDAALTELKLDGTIIAAPYTFLARELTAGTHTLEASCTDIAGNTAVKSISFKTEDFDPKVGAVKSEMQGADSATLYVQIIDSKGTNTQVEFLKGNVLTVGNGGISVKAGEGDYALQTAQASHIGTATSENGKLPYQLFTLSTGELNASDKVKVDWKGSADYNGDIRMYVLNTSSSKWEQIGTATTTSSAINITTSSAISVEFAAKNHITDGKATILVQCRSEKSYPSTSGTDSVKANNPKATWDGTAVPENYDFSMAWITDTQYYTESWPEHYSNMNQWIIDNRDKYDIQYTIHTGDIIDEWDMDFEWQAADKAMKLFDDADMRYGVLAGNHDVSAGDEEYDNYWKYFGEKRFKDKDYYGGSYKNNLGHYDLLTVDGQDLIILYMSWDIYTKEIQWMNEILSKYSNRKAIICLHRYINQDGVLDDTGKLLQTAVVAKNPNVFAVLNGHYHGAAIQVDGYDDNKDGINDRNVYQICTDYQSAPEGGTEYIKMLYFDLKNNKVYMNSYSPALNDFNLYDTAKLASYAPGLNICDLDIYECDVAFDTAPKSLSTDSLTAGVYTENLIGKLENAGNEVQITWKDIQTSESTTWYSRITNENGGKTITQLKTTTSAAITINSIEQVNVTTTVGTAPVLPNTVTAYYSDNSTALLSVEWNTIDPAQYSSAGSFTVEGAVSSTTMSAIALVTVVPRPSDHDNHDNHGSSPTTTPTTLPTTAPVTNPVIVDKGTIKVEGKPNANGTATVEISADNLNTAINNVKDGIIAIEVKTPDNVKEVKVGIPIEQIASNKNGIESITVDTGFAIVTIKSELLKNSNITASSKLQLSVTKVDTAVLGEETRKRVGNGKVYDFELMLDGKKISSFDNNEISIQLTYNLKPGEDSGKVIVYYINDSGKLEIVKNSKYNDNNEIVDFEPKHLSKYVAAYADITFDDLTNVTWAKNSIEALAAREIISGVGNNIFNPNNKITRAEFLTILMNAFDLGDGNADCTFTDASKGKWYYSSIAAAQKLGIIQGKTDGSFGINDVISRQDMAVMMYKAAKLLKVDIGVGDSPAKFTDYSEISTYAAKAINAMHSSKIISGTGNGIFAPKSSATRAEAAVVIYKVFNLVK